LRNTGASGVVEGARNALAQVDVRRFARPDAASFARELNRVTEEVRRQLPVPADRWGNARKAINLFLRDVLYNAYLAQAYHFRTVEEWLELPLGSYTATALRGEGVPGSLPRWPGVGNAVADTYAAYQAAADLIAKMRGIARVYLDIYWWREPPVST
jgi:hypothetical protein